MEYTISFLAAIVSESEINIHYVPPSPPMLDSLHLQGEHQPPGCLHAIVILSSIPEA